MKKSKITKIEILTKKYNNKCVCCGCEFKDIKMAHFHHATSKTKKHNLSDMFGKYSNKAIKKELSKTIALCKNCHTLLHSTMGKQVAVKDTYDFINNIYKTL